MKKRDIWVVKDWKLELLLEEVVYFSWLQVITLKLPCWRMYANTSSKCSPSALKILTEEYTRSQEDIWDGVKELPSRLQYVGIYVSGRN